MADQSFHTVDGMGPVDLTDWKCVGVGASFKMC